MRALEDAFNAARLRIDGENFATRTAPAAARRVVRGIALANRLFVGVQTPELSSPIKTMTDCSADASVILGVNRTQDASVCLMHGHDVIWSIQKERLTRQKHHWGGVGDFRSVYCPRLPGLARPVDVLVECFSSDREIERLPAYERELGENLTIAPDCRCARISHHLSHLYSVFHPSPFDEAAVMIVDGQGSPAADFTEAWPGRGRTPAHWREVSSFYRATRGGVECLDKQLWDRDDDHPAGLGMFYFLLTQMMFPGEGNSGFCSRPAMYAFMMSIQIGSAALAPVSAFPNVRRLRS